MRIRTLATSVLLALTALIALPATAHAVPQPDDVGLGLSLTPVLVVGLDLGLEI